MSKGYEQEKDTEIAEFADVLPIDDVELDNDIREWLQTPPVQLKEYGFGEPDSEEDYYALLNELSELLMER
ncbi:hypothetical protein HPT25_14405 [Bacillus sp. BRMEA1]|uniref:hypothetical protein n=1 Tax=Neobacillus endophyticus TaxID=2738405 RepID=UPI00156358AF|nr:hypothetical protein [Neobacillus endophyticus]NRD78552.1 hypothetical protein [Neobacillus endophyticus]